MLKYCYVIIFYLIVNSLSTIAMDNDWHHENGPFTPRTNKLIETSKDYEFDPAKQETFNIDVVHCAATIFSNPGAIFARGLLYELGLEKESEDENSLSCYLDAGQKECLFAYERLYWAFINGELGLEKDEKTAEFYGQLYRTITGRTLVPGEYSYLPDPDLLKEPGKMLSSQKNKNSPHKQTKKRRAYKKSISCYFPKISKKRDCNIQ